MNRIIFLLISKRSILQIQNITLIIKSEIIAGKLQYVKMMFIDQM
jgi:hypothetical protein